MAKAILEFDLNESDDIAAHTRAVKSLDMALALWEFAYNTKKKLGWDLEQELEKNPELSHYEVLDKVYEKFWEIMDEHGIKVDNLVV